MTNGITNMVEAQSKHNYHLLLGNGGTLPVNSYMFRPLYRPSPVFIPTCYKVTIHYTQWLLLMTRFRSP
jgi:hypothetical protein